MQRREYGIARKLGELRRSIENLTPVPSIVKTTQELVTLVAHDFLAFQISLTSAIDELASEVDVLAEQPSTAFCFPPAITIHASVLAMDQSRCREESGDAKARLEALLCHLSRAVSSASGLERHVLTRDIAMALAARSRLHKGNSDLHGSLEYSRRSRNVARESADAEMERLALYLQAHTLRDLGQDITAAALRQIADRLVWGQQTPSTILLDFKLWGMAEKHDRAGAKAA